MILLEIVELIDERTKQERVQSGQAAQRAVKDELRRRFGDQIRRIKLARVGSKLFDISADIHNVHQKVEVKSMSSEKPFFAFFDTYVTKGAHSPLLDELTKRITRGQYDYFSQAVEQEPDGGFPCDGEDQAAKGIRSILGTPPTPAAKPGTPKSGRVPKILKNVTDPYTLDFVRAKLLEDLAGKQITYLALLNTTTGKVDYYHISGENYLDAPKMPQIKKAFFDTYGAPMHCAMRVVVRIVV